MLKAKAIPVDSIEVKFLESFEIDRLKNMARESAINLLASALSVDYGQAEKFYNLIFKK